MLRLFKLIANRTAYMKKACHFWMFSFLGMVMLSSLRGVDDNVDPSEKFAATDVTANSHEQESSPLMMFGGEHGTQSSEEQNQQDPNRLNANDPHREHGSDLENNNNNNSNFVQRGDLSNGIQEEEKKKEEISELTLKNFRDAIANYPNAERLILNDENKIVPQEEDSDSPGANRSANKKVLEYLQAALQARYGQEFVQSLNQLSVLRSGTIVYNYHPLSAATVTEVLNSLPLEDKPAIRLDEIEPHFATTEATSFDSIFNRPAFLKEKEAIGEIIQQLVRESFKTRFACFRANHSKLYEKANTAWEKQFQTFQDMIKTLKEQDNVNNCYKEREKLLKECREIRKNADPTNLEYAAKYSDKTAAFLTIVLGPMAANIARAFSGFLEIYNTTLKDSDVCLHKANVEEAKNNLAAVGVKIKQAYENLIKASQQAQEQEKNARFQETIARREIATALQPPIMSFDEKAWRTWAEKLISSNQAIQDPEKLITQIAEYGMSDPSWAADLVHAAWDWESVERHQQQEKNQLQKSLNHLENSLDKARKALLQAEEIQKNAEEKVTDLQEKHALAVDDQQKLEIKLHEKGISRTDFVKAFRSLEETCALINNYNDQLQQALNELAQAEEAKNLLQDNRDFAQETLVRATERIAATEEHPLKSKLPFRLPKKINVNALTIEQVEVLEQQQSGMRKGPQEINPPIMLQKVAEFLGRKLHEELEGKNSSPNVTTSQVSNPLPLLLNPTAADRSRWEAMERIEALAQEREKADQLYQQSLNQNSSTATSKTELKTIAEEDEEEEESEDGYLTPEEEPNEAMGNLNNCHAVALSAQQPASTRSRTASISSRSSNDSFKSTKSHVSRASRKSFLERMQRDFRSSDSDTSSILSYKTTKTSRNSDDQSVGSMQSHNSNKSSRSSSSNKSNSAKKVLTSKILKEDLTKAENALKQEKEKWIKQVEEDAKRQGKNIPQDSQAYEAFLEEQKRDDARDYAAWKEHRDIAAKALGAAHQLKNWGANTKRWEARWEADRCHADLKGLKEILNPLQEELQIAEESAKEAEEKWITLANLEESVQAQPDEEKKKLAREKLEELDRATKIFWENFQKDHSRGKYIERSKKAEQQKNKSARIAEEYKHDLVLEKIETMATCFAKATTAELAAHAQYVIYQKARTPESRNEAERLYQLADEAEKEARNTYAKAMQKKALQDAVEKTPGALKAWLYLFERAIEEKAPFQSVGATAVPTYPPEESWANEAERKAKRLEFFVQADQEALKTFTKADQDFDRIEKIWHVQWDQEKEKQQIHRWRAVKNYFNGNKNLWEELSTDEREQHNQKIHSVDSKYKEALLKTLDPLKKQLNSIQAKINGVRFHPSLQDMEAAEAAEKAMREAIQGIGHKLALARWWQLKERTENQLTIINNTEVSTLENICWNKLTHLEQQAELNRLCFKFTSNEKQARKDNKPREAETWACAHYTASLGIEYLKNVITVAKANNSNSLDAVINLWNSAVSCIQQAVRAREAQVKALANKNQDEAELQEKIAKILGGVRECQKCYRCNWANYGASNYYSLAAEANKNAHYSSAVLNNLIVSSGIEFFVSKISFLFNTSERNQKAAECYLKVAQACVAQAEALACKNQDEAKRYEKVVTTWGAKYPGAAFYYLLATEGEKEWDWDKIEKYYHRARQNEKGSVP